MWKRTAARATSPPSALEELLVAEREIAAVEDAAGREAAAIVEAARREAEGMERDGAAGLVAELRALDQSAAEERAAIIASLERDADAVVARYQGLTDEDVTRLAASIADSTTGLALATDAEGTR